MNPGSGEERDFVHGGQAATSADETLDDLRETATARAEAKAARRSRMRSLLATVVIGNVVFVCVLIFGSTRADADSRSSVAAVPEEVVEREVAPPPTPQTRPSFQNPPPAVDSPRPRATRTYVPQGELRDIFCRKLESETQEEWLERIASYCGV